MNRVRLRRLSVTAMLCAFAYAAMFVFRFKVSFLTFDFKDAVLSLIGLLYGPFYGLAGALGVALLELLSVSDTGIYGFIMNFLSSGAFVLTVGTIYKYRRTFSGAIVASVLAVVTTTSVMLLANLFITPYYMGVERTAVIDMLPTLLLPFNLCKTAMNSAVMLIIYKPVTQALRRARLIEGAESGYRFGTKTVLLAICSALLAAGCAAVLIYVLGGSVNFFGS